MVTRTTLMEPKIDTNMQVISPIVFSTPYSPHYKEITSIVKKYLLMVDEKMADILKDPVKFVAHRARTIENMVSPNLYWNEKAASNWLTTTGFFRCGHSICKVRKFVEMGNTFHSYSQPRTLSFEIKSCNNCNSKNVIYIIGCHTCKK